MSEKKITHWGFTGTRRGMTAPQTQSVLDLFHRLEPDWLHHGCAVGADREAHEAARLLGIKLHGYPVFKHAPVELLQELDAQAPFVMDPLVRNHWIVAATGLLLAVPGERNEVQRSGTWATIRYARKKGRMIIYVWPDGQIETHHYVNTKDPHIPEEK